MIVDSPISSTGEIDVGMPMRMMFRIKDVDQ